LETIGLARSGESPNSRPKVATCPDALNIEVIIMKIETLEEINIWVCDDFYDIDFEAEILYCSVCGKKMKKIKYKRIRWFYMIKKFADAWKEYGTKYDWKYFQKRPVVVKAIRMDKDFEVETLEGTMKGKAGDYLIEGVEGELYPCDYKIFQKTYKTYWYFWCWNDDCFIPKDFSQIHREYANTHEYLRRWCEHMGRKRFVKECVRTLSKQSSDHFVDTNKMIQNKNYE